MVGRKVPEVKAPEFGKSVAALSLNIFHRHTERVRMTAIAQMVNVLQAMILTDKEQMVLTPTYHVFEMYIPFQGATPFETEVKTPDYKTGTWTLPAVDVSAARGADGKLYVALVNLDPTKAATVTANLAGAKAKETSGRILTAPAMDSRNTFDKPNAVQPASFKGSRKGDAFVWQLPAKSVAVVALE